MKSDNYIVAVRKTLNKIVVLIGYTKTVYRVTLFLCIVFTYVLFLSLFKRKADFN